MLRPTTQYSTASRPSYRGASVADRVAAFVGNPEFREVAAGFAVCAGLVMGPIKSPQVIRAQPHAECRQAETVPLRRELNPLLARAFRLPSIATTASASTTLLEPFVAT